MTLKLICLFPLLLTYLVGLAENSGDYDASKISPALLKNTCAVKRMEEIRFEIINPGKAFYYYKKAVTILNEKGDKYASWAAGYDKNTIIKSVDARLYDASGKKIKSLKNADIGDVSSYDGFSLASDGRVKFHDFNCRSYPYTVEYEVEIRYNYLMFMPRWRPVEHDGYAVEQSIFEVVAPLDYKLRYKSFRYNKAPEITEKKEKLYRWQVTNVAALNDEFAAPEWHKITPTVILGATNFEVDEYKGDMSDWKSFGKFVYSLKEKRDALPDAVKVKVHELTDGISDVQKKISVLYNYLQQNTRYVSIQLGIGGWQPFDAKYVAANKYGDCKALTNFMYALLKEAGVPSVYTLVNSGATGKDIIEDFASQQFNHVILSVPLAKDTTWLECTSQTLPAGYLGTFTEDRYALMITEEGGKLVRTPAYKAKENLQSRKTKATVDETGKLTATITTDYRAMEQDDLFSYINAYSKKEQLEWLKRKLDIPNYDITTFDYKTSAGKLPVVTETLNITAENYAQVSGRRMFIHPNILSKVNIQLNDEERTQDIELVYEYTDKDSAEIIIPSGFSAESMPEPVTIQNRFGNYKIEYILNGNKLLMIRNYEKKSGRFPKSEYKALVKFYSDIYKADRAKVVLVKKEG